MKREGWIGLRWISEKGVVGRGDTPPVGVRFFGWVGLYIIGCWEKNYLSALLILTLFIPSSLYQYSFHVSVSINTIFKMQSKTQPDTVKNAPRVGEIWPQLIMGTKRVQMGVSVKVIKIDHQIVPFIDFVKMTPRNEITGSNRKSNRRCSIHERLSKEESLYNRL